MPDKWTKIAVDDFDSQIMKPAKAFHDGLAEILTMAKSAGMQEFYVLWAQDHADKLNDIDGIRLRILGSMPDQTYSFEKGVPSKIERNQKKNNRAKTAPADGAQPVSETPVKKKKGAK